MTILGMAIVIAQLWREVGPMRVQLRQLRDEVGRLTIDDPTKFHAIRVRSDNDYLWKWRVWVPEGREYRINMATQGIPKDGYPQSQGMITHDQTGESWIEYRIVKDPNSNSWTDKLSTPSGSVGSSSQPWVTWGSRVTSGMGVGYKTEVSEPNGRVVLARERVSKKAKGSGDIEDPSAGFMIWLEPVK